MKLRLIQTAFLSSNVPTVRGRLGKKNNFAWVFFPFPYFLLKSTYERGTKMTHILWPGQGSAQDLKIRQKDLVLGIYSEIFIAKDRNFE